MCISAKIGFAYRNTEPLSNYQEKLTHSSRLLCKSQDGAQQVLG